MSEALLLLATASSLAGPVAVPTYEPSRSLAPLVKAVAPAVVTLEVESRVELPALPPELLRSLPFDPHQIPQVRNGEGSGFFVSEDGELVTNWHVVEGATAVTVVFDDGREVPAKVVGGDRALDLALLRIESETPVPWLQLGGDEQLEVGDWVLAMGDGLGLGTTATLGILSGKGRAVGSILSGEFLQTDAAINEGNSGGPLFALDGRVVGMSTAIVEGANTVAFAIPASRIAAVLDDLRRGHVARGYLGVSPQTLSEDLREGLGVRAQKGAVVTGVVDGTPAEKAGLQAGDVIVAVDGDPIDDQNDLVRTIAAHPPGERVRLDIERGTRARHLDVVLAERPDGTRVGTPEPEEEPAPTEVTGIGLALAPLTPAVAAGTGASKGVLVERVARGGTAEGRLRPGDVILEVDRREVSSPEEVERAFARSAGNVFLLVLRNGNVQFVMVPRPD
ncbi:MAG: trypsin-like peptidase domain-containing protein [Alphaproteobacteria bacterium]|nr:trypsin-like peptidase domain-containing protein [Alphaproteobacteria bacterium]